MSANFRYEAIVFTLLKQFLITNLLKRVTARQKTRRTQYNPKKPKSCGLNLVIKYCLEEKIKY